MARYGTVQVNSRDGSGNYFATPVMGKRPLILSHSANLGPRPHQPIRIFRIREGNYVDFAFQHRWEDWDKSIPSALEGKNTLKVSSIVLYDSRVPNIKYKDSPTSLIVISRYEDDCQQTIDSLGNLSAGGRENITRYAAEPDISVRGQVGVRAMVQRVTRGLEFLMKDSRTDREQLFVPVNHLLSMPERSVDIRAMGRRFVDSRAGIDREVLRLCLQYVQFT